MPTPLKRQPLLGQIYGFDPFAGHGWCPNRVERAQNLGLDGMASRLAAWGHYEWGSGATLPHLRSAGGKRARNRHILINSPNLMNAKIRLLLAAALLLGATSQLNAQIYIIRWIWIIGGGGGGWTPTRSFEVAVQGDYAYVANKEGGLHILNVTNRQALRWVSSIQTGGQARGVAVSGNYAYLADDTNGLQVIDVSNPFAPTNIGGLVPSTNGAAHKVRVAGNRAYLADGNGGLQIIDVSNPAAPSRIGGFDTGGFAADVAVAGNYAFVADSSSGLQVIDVTDPSAPVRAGSLATTNSPEAVVLSGQYAFLPSGYGGLVIVNVSNPHAPRFESKIDPAGGWAMSVAVSGDFAFVGRANDGALLVLNVAVPSAPSFVGFLNAGSYSGEGCYSVAVSGGGGYVSTGLGLATFDPASPTLITDKFVYYGHAQGVAVSGNYGYVADSEAGLAVVDVSNPASARVVGRAATGNYSGNVALSGNYAYVADGYDGLTVFDVSNAASPTKIGGVFFNGYWGTDVCVAGGYAYVAAQQAGLKVVDVRIPAMPTLVRTVMTTDEAFAVAAAGNYVYVVGGFSGGSLDIVDVTNPLMPSRVGSLRLLNDPRDVVVSGNYAYVAVQPRPDGSGPYVGGGLLVIDISNPTAPSVVGKLDTPGWASGVGISGTHAYVADWSIHSVDVSDPTRPYPLGSMLVPNYAPTKVTLSGSRLYAVDPDRGLGIFDVANSPEIIQAAQSQSSVAGDTATFTIMATGNGTLHYEWRRNGSPLTNGGRISGANTPTLTITNVHGVDGGAYEVVVTNAYGAMISFAPAVLTVRGPQLTVTKASSGPLKFRFPSVAGLTYEVWQKPSLGVSYWNVIATLPGTGGAIEFTPPLSADQSGYFTVRVQ